MVLLSVIRNSGLCYEKQHLLCQAALGRGAAGLCVGTAVTGGAG